VDLPALVGEDDPCGAGEGRGAHQELVHFPGGLPALRDAPDHQALPPPAVPRREHPLHARRELPRVRRNVAALLVQLQLLQHLVARWSGGLWWPGGLLGSGGQVAGWSDGQVVRWSSGQVTRWPGGQVVKWPGDQVVKWPGDQVASWSGGQVVRWPGDQVARWPGGQVARWSGGQVTRWPGGQV